MKTILIASISSGFIAVGLFFLRVLHLISPRNDDNLTPILLGAIFFHIFFLAIARFGNKQNINKRHYLILLRLSYLFLLLIVLLVGLVLFVASSIPWRF